MGGCKLGQGQNSSKNLANHVWRAWSQGQEVPVLVGDGESEFKAHQAQPGSLELVHLIPSCKKLPLERL